MSQRTRDAYIVGTMLSTCLFLTVLLPIACTRPAAISPPAETNAADLGQRLRDVPPSHPRLFVSDAEMPDLRAKVEADPLLTTVFEYVKAQADDMVESGPIERIMHGRRLSSAWHCNGRVVFLAFMYRMTGSQPYLEAARRDMLAAAAFEDWNPSHFLDVSELTTALAVGYDWLYNDLDPEARQRIRDAIVEKGLRTSMRHGGWTIARNNWSQVCHGGLVLGALAVSEDEPELAEQIIARALRGVPHAMEEYGPDGVHPEGPGYWKYGTTFNLFLISALESVLGSDFALSASPGFMDTAEFYLHATGPTGRFFNYSDSGERGGVEPAMHWFAARTNDQSLLWNERSALERLQNGDRKQYIDRHLPFLLIWAEPVGQIPPPARLHWKGDGRTPVAMHRGGWDQNATFIAIKGGSASTSHAHMDVGSFVLDMDGVRWAVDLGAQSYNSLESIGINLWDKTQNSDRWSVFRLNNLSHNTLVVDGQLQLFRPNAPIVAFSDDEASPHSVVDMSPVYEGQVASAKRGVRLAGTSVLVQDDVETLNRRASVRWGMVTRAQVTVSDDRTATLRQDGKAMTLRVLSPQNAKLAILDLAKPPSAHDAENPDTRMVSFEVAISPSTAETLAVYMEIGDTPGESPSLSSLDTW